MFEKLEKEFRCPSCGVSLCVKYRGNQVVHERCPGCGVDIMFTVQMGSCRSKLGFQRSEMHGPILAECKILPVGYCNTPKPC